MPHFTDPDISLIANIFDLMQSDDANLAKESQILLSYYSSASEKSKESINNCFIALCGYSLQSIIDDMAAVAHA